MQRGGVTAGPALALVLFSVPCAADELRTLAGDRLTGALVSLNGATVTFRPAATGTDLTLPLSNLVRLETAGPVTVGLTGGDRVVGRLTYAHRRFLIHSGALGTITLAPAVVAGVGPIPGSRPGRPAVALLPAEEAELADRSGRGDTAAPAAPSPAEGRR